MKILVVGSGGREHAISWRLAQSPLVEKIVCVPGNGGTARESKCRNVPPTSGGIDGVVQTALAEKADMVVVGPEDPLCAGLADALWAKGIRTVGPKEAGAVLEGSKDKAKAFMKKYGVASAASETFTSAEEACAYIRKHGAPIVVKADGLAAGKGVVVAPDVQTALAAVSDFMENGTLGNAGTTLVIEDYLQGVEISILAAVSVTPELTAAEKSCIVPFVPARDHKRLKDGAKGPNTGGMGAVAPLSDVTQSQLDAFNRTILEPTLRGLQAEQLDYRGFIFFGVMLCADGPKLLEYNVRLGDPETQAVLPLMDFDFVELCNAIIDEKQTGALKAFSSNVKWKPGFVCAPVAVSGGYPAKYAKGCAISFAQQLGRKGDAKVFIAGAQLADGSSGAEKQLATSGGRVLAAAGYGKTFEESRMIAYKALESISFDGMFYRRDIGLPGAAESGAL